MSARKGKGIVHAERRNLQTQLREIVPTGLDFTKYETSKSHNKDITKRYTEYWENDLSDGDASGASEREQVQNVAWWIEFKASLKDEKGQDAIALSDIDMNNVNDVDSLDGVYQSIISESPSLESQDSISLCAVVPVGMGDSDEKESEVVTQSLSSYPNQIADSIASIEECSRSDGGGIVEEGATGNRLETSKKILDPIEEMKAWLLGDLGDATDEEDGHLPALLDILLHSDRSQYAAYQSRDEYSAVKGSHSKSQISYSLSSPSVQELIDDHYSPDSFANDEISLDSYEAKDADDAVITYDGDMSLAYDDRLVFSEVFHQTDELRSFLDIEFDEARDFQERKVAAIESAKTTIPSELGIIAYEVGGEVNEVEFVPFSTREGDDGVNESINNETEHAIDNVSTPFMPNRSIINLSTMEDDSLDMLRDIEGNGVTTENYVDHYIDLQCSEDAVVMVANELDIVSDAYLRNIDSTIHTVTEEEDGAIARQPLHQQVKTDISLNNAVVEARIIFSESYEVLDGVINASEATVSEQLDSEAGENDLCADDFEEEEDATLDPEESTPEDVDMLQQQDTNQAISSTSPDICSEGDVPDPVCVDVHLAESEVGGNISLSMLLFGYEDDSENSETSSSQHEQSPMVDNTIALDTPLEILSGTGRGPVAYHGGLADSAISSPVVDRVLPSIRSMKIHETSIVVVYTELLSESIDDDGGDSCSLVPRNRCQNNDVSHCSIVDEGQSPRDEELLIGVQMEHSPDVDESQEGAEKVDKQGSITSTHNSVLQIDEATQIDFGDLVVDIQSESSPVREFCDTSQDSGQAIKIGKQDSGQAIKIEKQTISLNIENSPSASSIVSYESFNEVEVAFNSPLLPNKAEIRTPSTGSYTVKELSSRSSSSSMYIHSPISEVSITPNVAILTPPSSKSPTAKAVSPSVGKLYENTVNNEHIKQPVSPSVQKDAEYESVAERLSSPQSRIAKLGSATPNLSNISSSHSVASRPRRRPPPITPSPALVRYPNEPTSDHAPQIPEYPHYKRGTAFDVSPLGSGNVTVRAHAGDFNTLSSWASADSSFLEDGIKMSYTPTPDFGSSERTNNNEYGRAFYDHRKEFGIPNASMSGRRPPPVPPKVIDHERGTPAWWSDEAYTRYQDDGTLSQRFMDSNNENEEHDMSAILLPYHGVPDGQDGSGDQHSSGGRNNKAFQKNGSDGDDEDVKIDDIIHACELIRWTLTKDS